jgi:hypothetical protein
MRCLTTIGGHKLGHLRPDRTEDILYFLKNIMFPFLTLLCIKHCFVNMDQWKLWDLCMVTLIFVRYSYGVFLILNIIFFKSKKESDSYFS